MGDSILGIRQEKRMKSVERVYFKAAQIGTIFLDFLRPLMDE
jgi:hypothetical protein